MVNLVKFTIIIWKVTGDGHGCAVDGDAGGASQDIVLIADVVALG